MLSTLKSSMNLLNKMEENRNIHRWLKSFKVRIWDIKSHSKCLNDSIDLCYKRAFPQLCSALRKFIRKRVDPDEASKDFLVRLIIWAGSLPLSWSSCQYLVSGSLPILLLRLLAYIFGQAPCLYLWIDWFKNEWINLRKYIPLVRGK